MATFDADKYCIAGKNLRKRNMFLMPGHRVCPYPCSFIEQIRRSHGTHVSLEVMMYPPVCVSAAISNGSAATWRSTMLHARQGKTHCSRVVKACHMTRLITPEDTAKYLPRRSNPGMMRPRPSHSPLTEVACNESKRVKYSLIQDPKARRSCWAIKMRKCAKLQAFLSSQHSTHSDQTSKSTDG